MDDQQDLMAYERERIQREIDLAYGRAFYDELMKEIRAILDRTPQGKRADLLYTNNAGETFVIRSMSFRRPNLILLYGKDAQDNECICFVHIQSLQLRIRVR